MNILTILALVMVIPILLVPVVLVWYINFGGMLETIKEAKAVKLGKRITVR